MMTLLFIGDIFGAPGRRALRKYLPGIIKEHNIDLVIANAENAAHGKGITSKIYEELLRLGITMITMGNHAWNKVEYLDVLDRDRIIRPLNLNPLWDKSSLGVGSRELEYRGLKVRVTNILGNSVNFAYKSTNAFDEMTNLLAEIEKPDIHIVDLHAETTSEKYAFLWAFNGKVDAILGTHTHIPTNDALITYQNTAFMCDVGMTGPSNGVIGADRDSVIKRAFNPTIPFLFEVSKGPLQFSSVILEYDEDIRQMVSITPLTIKEKEGFKYVGTPHVNFV